MTFSDTNFDQIPHPFRQLMSFCISALGNHESFGNSIRCNIGKRESIDRRIQRYLRYRRRQVDKERDLHHSRPSGASEAPMQLPRRSSPTRSRPIFRTRFAKQGMTGLAVCSPSFSVFGSLPFRYEHSNTMTRIRSHTCG